MSLPRVRVLVVDDQELVRRGVAKLLEIEESIAVVGEAVDGVHALALVPTTRPDVVLVDARMPRMDGVELVRRLSADHPGIAAVVLTTFDDDDHVFGGLRAGAKGYLLKDIAPDDLVAAIHKAHRGETVLGGPIAGRVVAELTRSPGPATSPPRGEVLADLSTREVEVARLVATGASNHEISRVLFISEGTARNHVSSVLRKLGLRDRTQLALWAARHGLTEPG